MKNRLPRVLGVLAGNDVDGTQFQAWLNWADRVVAADGGADLCRAAGREPDQIVGDLDSISDAAGLTPDPDQNSSDADKLLKVLLSDDAEPAEVALFGVEGDRVDHVIATFYSCARAETQMWVRLILRTDVAYVWCAPFFGRFQIKGRFSLIPIGRAVVSIKGAKWDLDQAELSPEGLVSLSNHALEGRVWIEVHEGSVAAFLGDRPMP